MWFWEGRCVWGGGGGVGRVMKCVFGYWDGKEWLGVCVVMGVGRGVVGLWRVGGVCVCVLWWGWGVVVVGGGGEERCSVWFMSMGRGGVVCGLCQWEGVV